MPSKHCIPLGGYDAAVLNQLYCRNDTNLRPFRKFSGKYCYCRDTDSRRKLNDLVKYRQFIWVEIYAFVKRSFTTAFLNSRGTVAVHRDSFSTFVIVGSKRSRFSYTGLVGYRSYLTGLWDSFEKYITNRLF